jgi:hypothetical protein
MPNGFERRSVQRGVPPLIPLSECGSCRPTWSERTAAVPIAVFLDLCADVWRPQPLRHARKSSAVRRGCDPVIYALRRSRIVVKAARITVEKAGPTEATVPASASSQLRITAK